MSQQNLLPVALSTDLPVLSTEQQDRLQIQILLAGKMTHSLPAKKIIAATYYPLLREVDVSVIVEKIGIWRAFTGAMKDVSENQMLTEAEFVKKQYPLLTIKDFENAIYFFLDGDKLQADIPDYLNFSPAFISKVLNAYVTYKNPIVKTINYEYDDYLMRVEDHEKNIPIRVKAIKQILVDCYKHCQDNFKERFYNSMVFNFLVRTKRIIVTDQLKKDASVYANKKHGEDTKIEEERKKKETEERKNHEEKTSTKEPQHIFRTLDMTPATTMGRMQALEAYCKDYALRDFFSSNDIGDIVESVTEKDFAVPKPPSSA